MNLSIKSRIENVRTGVYTFSPPQGRLQENALYSDEIDHGLGRGEAFLSFAIDHAPDVVDDYGSAGRYSLAILQLLKIQPMPVPNLK